MQTISKTMIRTALLVALAGLAAIGPEARAQEQVDSEDIVNALKPSKPLVKSLARSETELSNEEEQFVRGLGAGTKQITVVERQKVAAIVDEKKLSTIDLEIYFDYDSAAITPTAIPELLELGKALASDDLKSERFLLAGHTDAAGGEDYNQTLSEKRANAVRSFLSQNHAIPEGQLVVAGFGEESLKNPDNPEADENRRVQIVRLGR